MANPPHTHLPFSNLPFLAHKQIQILIDFPNLPNTQTPAPPPNKLTATPLPFPSPPLSSPNPHPSPFHPATPPGKNKPPTRKNKQNNLLNEEEIPINNSAKQSRCHPATAAAAVSGTRIVCGAVTVDIASARRVEGWEGVRGGEVKSLGAKIVVEGGRMVRRVWGGFEMGGLNW